MMEITMILKDMLRSGLDQSRSALNACLFELGKHQDIQRLVHDEIRRAFSNKGGELSYQELQQITILDCFVIGKS